MRVFIAIGFDELRSYFVELQEMLPKDNARLTLPKSFHLTLKFLGEIHEYQLKGIIERLEKIKFKPFPVTLSKIGFFPFQKKSRVVWVRCYDNTRAISLQTTIEKSLQGMFPKDERFHPHITICRVKYLRDKHAFLSSLLGLRPEQKTVEVNEFKLIKSTLTPQGPIYEEIAVFPKNQVA